MSQTLSQDEVNALLRGMAEGEVEVGTATEAGGSVRAYNLISEERVAARQFPGLDQVHQRFVRQMRQSLSSFVGSICQVELGGVEALKFGTFRNRLPVAASIHLFTMAPLRGRAVLVISASLAFGIIDRVFGGAGRTPSGIEARECSPIEMQMVQRLANRVLADLSEAWAPLHRIECRYARSESNPTQLAVAASGDTMFVLTLQCSLGAEPSSLIVAVPYAALEPLGQRLGMSEESTPTAADRDWMTAMSNVVRQTLVTVTAELGSHDIAMREVLRLKAGDVIPLRTRGDDPVSIRVEGVRLMSGLAGVSRSQNAVRVLAYEKGE